jgi:hypothetical protein
MNERDRNNLAFLEHLMNKGNKAIEQWAATQTEDDIIYAMELLTRSLTADMVRLVELEEQFDEEHGLDCTQANEIINRVKKESL